MLTPTLAGQIRQTWREEGERWVSGFASHFALAVSKWDLEDLVPFEDLSYHFVASGTMHGKPVVLKMGVPSGGFKRQIHALRAFDGHSMVRLLDVDQEIGAMLLERVSPGRSLADKWSPSIDEEHTRIIAQLMVGIRVAPTPDLPTLHDWSQVLHEIAWSPNDLHVRARDIWSELESEAPESTLLHGDLHHHNVLSSDGSWVAIDPKGVCGDPGFEVYALLGDPLQATGEELCSLADSRLAIAAEVTGMDPQRLRLWGYCGVVLSACWSILDGEQPDVKRLQLAEHLK